MLSLSASCIAALVTGCVERRVVYVPTQPTKPVYAYPPQTPPPAPNGAPSQSEAQPVPPPSNPVAEAPPALQVETIPVAPGPEYVWTPGYWSWSVGRWVWVGGRYLSRPRPHAIWVGGHWARHGRGYVWIGGHWR